MDELTNSKAQARTETVCRGCGGEKEAGLIVCWPCFKYREDVVPFKYFDGDALAVAAARMSARVLTVMLAEEY